MSKHVSVSATTYARLQAFCDRTGRSMSSVIEEATRGIGVADGQSSSPLASPAPISSSSSSDTAST